MTQHGAGPASNGIEVHYRNCPFCEAMCGVKLTVDRTTNEVLSIRGDAEDPASKGYLCVKARALGELRSDPDRVRQPLRRRGRDFEEIGWDEAIDEACERLRATQAAYGRDSVGYYIGNSSSRPGLGFYSTALRGALQSKQMYWVGPIDQSPRLLANLLMFGGARPLPDLDRTDHLVIIGANPVVSNGSLVIAPGFARRMEAIRARGGRVVVIDPRRTETAAIADEHIPIRPGSDAYLLMAMVNTVFEESLVDLRHLAGVVSGLDELREVAQPFPAERVADACGVTAATIRRLTREFAAADRAAMYGRLGTCVQQFGSICNWLIDTMDVLTGHLDRPGGAMFSRGATLNVRALPQVGPPPIGRWRSRVRGLPEFMGMLPAAVLAEEILEPGDGQVKAFITQAGNAVLSHPNSDRVADAFRSLEFMLSLDIYVNETTRHADIILPSPDYLEDSDFTGGTSISMVRQYVKWSPPVFPRADGTPTDADILARLAAGIRGVPVQQVHDEMVDMMVGAARAAGRTECRTLDHDQIRAALQAEPGADAIFEILVRSGPYGDAFGAVPGGLDLPTMEASPHGLDFGPLEAELPEVLGTPDATIDLAPSLLVDDVARLHDELTRTADPSHLLLIGRRDRRSKNSWMHNLPLLANGNNRCHLSLHPVDAERLGLADGDLATVTSDVGSLSVPVELDDAIMPGVVSIPHGWGHDDAVDGGQRLAAAKPGVNTNVLIGEGLLDVPSGSSALNGVPVMVERALV